MKESLHQSVEVAPGDLGESLISLRLYSPAAQQQMQLSLSKLGQLTPVQVVHGDNGLEIIDGFKRARAARDLSWPTLRAEVQRLDAAGAKVRLWQCNVGAGLSDLEEAWLIRSLHRQDGLTQPQIAILLARHKSWVCRRLALAEDLSDELTASVRLGLLSATAAVELARLQRCNQDEVAQAVVRRGLTTRQTARLINALLSAPQDQWPKLLEQDFLPPVLPKGGTSRRTPGEQLVADSWAMKRLAVRLQTRLIERSLESLGEPACDTVASELALLRATLRPLITTLDARLRAYGVANATS
jgi:ParB-like chromosome segregation protein Spo0J